MAYACVRTDNMAGTLHGKDLVSLSFDGEIENGNILVVGDYVDGEREVRETSVPTATTELRDIALVASEEVVKDKTYNSLSDFINLEGTIIRGYRLVSRDIFSVTIEALEVAEGVTPAVGYAVELTDGTKLAVVETATEGSTQVGTITAIEDEWYVIEVR